MRFVPRMPRGFLRGKRRVRRAGLLMARRLWQASMREGRESGRLAMNPDSGLMAPLRKALIV